MTTPPNDQDGSTDKAADEDDKANLGWPRQGAVSKTTAELNLPAHMAAGGPASVLRALGGIDSDVHPAAVAIKLAATQGTPVVWLAGRPYQFHDANVGLRADATDVGPLITAALKIADLRRTQLAAGTPPAEPVPPVELVLDTAALAHTITTPGLADQLIALIRTGPEVDIRPRLGSSVSADHSVAGEHLVRVITVLLDLRTGSDLPADLAPDLADFAHQVVATTADGWDDDVRERALGLLRAAVR